MVIVVNAKVVLMSHGLSLALLVNIQITLGCTFYIVWFICRHLCNLYELF
jgi:hypothetical protein